MAVKQGLCSDLPVHNEPKVLVEECCIYLLVADELVHQHHPLFQAAYSLVHSVLMSACGSGY